VRYDVDQIGALTAAQKLQARKNIAVLNRGYLFGLKTENAADADHDITFNAGEAMSDDADPVLMALLAATTKQFDATFAEGTSNGGMVSGESLPTSGTVHFWLIMKADGTPDVCGNDHASSGLNPTLPTGFVYKRRIASARTDGSANIRPYKQSDDEFTLVAPIKDIADGTSSALSPTSRSLTVPIGIKVRARIVLTFGASNNSNALVYDPDLGTLSASATNRYTFVPGATVTVPAEIMTSTAGQVRTSSDGTSGAVGITTFGWIDRRGRLP
jgi:hypothetical protein